MSTPNIYRWDDNNAPVVAGQSGSAINLLKKCLVEGYGSQSPAGWSMPYCNDQGTLASFRINNETGSGFYLQIDNTSNANVALLSGYEDMTSATSGAKRFTNFSSGYYLETSYSRDSTPRPWILIADDRFFILFVFSRTTVQSFEQNITNNNMITNGVYPCMFGDAIPLSNSDNYFCISSASYVGQNSYAMHVSVPSMEKNYIYAARDMSGAKSALSCSLMSGGGPIYDLDDGPNHHSNLPDRIRGNEIVSRPYVNNGAPYTIRGHVPGLWNSCHKYTDFTQLERFDVGDHQFLVIKWASSDAWRRHVLIDISEHWR